MVIWGGKDRVVDPEGRKKVLAIPGSTYVGIDGGSHALMETAFPATVAAIKAFLGGLGQLPQGCRGAKEPGTGRS